MRRFISKKDIQSKRIVFICIILFLIIIMPCVVMYRYYYNNYRRSTLTAMEYAVAGNTERLQLLLNTIEAAIDCVNDNEKAYQTMNSRNISTIVDMIINYGIGNDHHTLRDIAVDKKNNEQFFESLFITALDSAKEELSCALIVSEEYPIAKHLYTWKPDGDGVFLRAEGMEKYDWYNEAVQKDGEIYWFKNENFPERLYMAKLLKYQSALNIDDYKVCDIGVILVNFNLSWMSDRINMSELTEGTLILVTDENGTIFFSNLDSEQFKKVELEYLLSNMEDGITFDYVHEKKHYLMQKNVLEQGLYVFTLIPDNEIQEITQGMVKTNLLMMLMIIMLCVVIMSIMSTYLWKPILKLAEHMKCGNMEQIEENLDRMDEIGVLYRGYNQMQHRIQELILKIWENAEEKRKMELQVLQAQINPHFLYNTLGAISCNALLNGQGEIADQITALSAIMRYNIKEQDALVPVKTELEMISRYEEIWHMSYGDDLEFCHNVNPNCENILIPKLIIQPLVENAILHGIDFNQGIGKIFIGAEVIEDNRLIIKVANNGNRADVGKLNAYVKGNCALDSDKDSIGVKNVCDRIEWYFGEDGELSYRINQEGNTEAVISIQVHSVEER